MNNLEFANRLTEAVKAAMDEESDIFMDDELKESIWKAIYAELNKEIH